MKGSLVNIRPDDLAASVVNQVLDRLPQLDRATIEDLICGCGLPGGEQGFNLGRVISILTARRTRPGRRSPATARPRCRRRAWPRTPSAPARATSSSASASSASRGSRTARSDMRAVPQRAPRARQSRGLPRRLHRDGPDRRERRGARGDLARGAGPVRAAQPAARGRGAGRRLLRPRDRARSTLPDGGGTITKDDGPRRETTLEKLAELKPVFRENGTVTAGNACPLNDGAAAVVIMSDTRAQGARHHAARPHRLHRPDRARAGVHGPRSDRGVAGRRSSAPG